jgi:hypothetical protein
MPAVSYSINSSQLAQTMSYCTAVFDGDNVFLHGADRIAHGLEQKTGSKWRGSYFMPAQADRWRSHMPSHGPRRRQRCDCFVMRTGALTSSAHEIPAIKQLLHICAGCILRAYPDSALFRTHSEVGLALATHQACLSLRVLDVMG